MTGNACLAFLMLAFAIAPLHAHAAQDDLQRFLLSAVERWDQHMLVRVGDLLHYRICQNGATCFDASLEAMGRSPAGQHFNVVVQDRLGYHVPGVQGSVRMGQVTGNVGQDTDAINFIWSNGISGPGHAMPQEQGTGDGMCASCPDGTDTFGITLDGMMSLGGNSSRQASKDMAMLELGLSELLGTVAPSQGSRLSGMTAQYPGWNAGASEPCRGHGANVSVPAGCSAKNPAGISRVSAQSIMHYLPELDSTDRFVYVMCLQRCAEFSLLYAGASRDGLHFEVSINHLDWYERSSDGIVQYWSHDPLPPERRPASLQLPALHEFEIVADDRWLLSGSPGYHYNKYIRALEETLFFLGGRARIGDGYLLQFEPVLEVGEKWGGHAGHDITVTGTKMEYFYNHAATRGNFHVVTYALDTGPAMEFVISPDVPFPLASTYIGDGNVLRNDPNNGSRSWFRMIDHMTMYESGDALVIGYDMHADSAGPGTGMPGEFHTSDNGPPDSDTPHITNQTAAPNAPPDTPHITNQTAPHDVSGTADMPRDPRNEPADAAAVPHADGQNTEPFPELDMSKVECTGSASCLRDTVRAMTGPDTLTTDKGVTVRLALATAPGTAEAAWAESMELMASACPPGSHIVVDEDDGRTGGSYDRMIGKVYCNGLNLNEYLLENVPESGINAVHCPASEFGFDVWAMRNGCWQ